MSSEIHASHQRLLDGFPIRSMALGTYLGNYDEKTDQQTIDAIKLAVSKGLNFIDTAINYRCMHSERAIGSAIRGLDRKTLFISTKGGFVPYDGEPTLDVQSLFEKEYVEKGIAEQKDLVAGCHCMTPDYLRDQIEKSRANLGLETIDLYYLHNPETQIPAVGVEEFYRRLEKAFETLEEACAQNKIARYGIATWNAFREAALDPKLVQLERCVEIAKKIAGEKHHFKAVQAPFNLGLPEICLVESQRVEGRSLTFLEAAQDLEIAVLTSVPLMQGQLAQGLPPIIREALGLQTDAQRSIRFVVSTPGVTSAMVGMKTVAHVEENLKVLENPVVPFETLSRVFNFE